MKFDLPAENKQKPLAGNCAHAWQDRRGRYLIEQVCTLCKLYRYKSNPTADWEYRAPIPFAASR